MRRMQPSYHSVAMAGTTPSHGRATGITVGHTVAAEFTLVY